MQLDLFHVALLIVILGLGVPWLKRRGVFGQAAAVESASIPPIVPGAANELNVLLAGIVNKLVSGLPLLSYEVPLLASFATKILDRMPGLETAMSAYLGAATPQPTPPAVPAPSPVAAGS